MTIQFRVAGPFRIPLKKERRSTLVDAERIKSEFWKVCEDEAKIPRLRHHNGCYVFGLRLPKNIVPYYIGKTWKGLRMTHSKRIRSTNKIRWWWMFSSGSAD
jgi:hypothetical protein